ncbi:MAG: type II CAAX endopeptidase family protein [bacterium]
MKFLVIDTGRFVVLITSSEETMVNSARSNELNRASSRASAQWIAFLVVAAPFYLNDFSSIFVKDWRLWLFIDYTSVKLFPLLVIVWLMRRKFAAPADFGLTVQRAGSFIAVFAAMTFIGTVIDQNLLPFLKQIFGGTAIGGMPDITSPVWNNIDLTFGLLLVGVMEELVFRGMMHMVLRRQTQSAAAIIAVSSIAFGLIHWSGGFHAIINATVIGAVFMIFYLRTRSTPALMLAHFTIDFIAFSGVIPKT